MSCTCQNTDNKSGCRCEVCASAPALHIAAGLDRIPRQIATFPEFRTAMLAGLRKHPAFNRWRAKAQDDPGVMLIEMWAYVCDSLAFYDEVIAQEMYLRTATERPALRRLVNLLGYRPRPAVAAAATLAAFADGKQPVKIPAGTQFRSGAFEGGEPQVFESDVETIIHPLTNRWNIAPPAENILGKANPAFLFVEASAEISVGQLVAVTNARNPDQNQTAFVKGVEIVRGGDRKMLTRINFQNALNLSANTSVDQLKVQIPTRTASLWTKSKETSVQIDKHAYVLLVLDNLYPQILPNDEILVVIGNDRHCLRIREVDSVSMLSNPDYSVTLGSNAPIKITGITVPVTRIKLDMRVDPQKGKQGNWTDDNRSRMLVHYGMKNAGTVTMPAKNTLLTGDLLRIAGAFEAPANGHQVHRFFLSDKNKYTVETTGNLHTDAPAALVLDTGGNWQQPLYLPVEAYGNVLNISRGEKVENEILGSGDASIPNQTFKLKKKPLTYLLAPVANNDQSVKNNLRIYVNGVRWTEVTSFFNKKENEQIYIVRQDDAGDSWVTFGDGIRGERLPPGGDNIVAYYRYGAGAAAPPAEAINQIGTPVKNLQSVKNPLSAFGGADAESTEQMRTYAPRSVLIMGRAVSVQDFEAVTLAIPGVRAVQAERRWNGERLQSIIHIWFIGENSIETLIRQRLRSMAEESVPLHVERSNGLKTDMELQIDIDPRYFEKDVLAEVRQVLTNPQFGLLSPENIGIGRAVFRSKIFDAVLQVKGTTSISGIKFNGQNFQDYGAAPGAGQYFDLEKGTLLLNGKTTES